jgi:hypothetical protein
MMANRRTAQMGREPIAQMGKLLKNGKVKGGAKQANRTDAFKRKQMAYSDKMYSESKRPPVSMGQAAEEAMSEQGKKFSGTY